MPQPPRKGSLLVIFLTVFIDLLGFGIVLPLLPIYAQGFTLDPSGWQLGALMASFSAMQFLFAPLWGRISDSVGRRPVILIGLAGSVVFYSLFAAATVYQSLALLFVSRIGAGIAGATIPTAQAYIADTTEAGDRAKGMALIGMAFGLGFTFGPLVGLLAIWGAEGKPVAGPGIAAALLSAVALGLAWFLLPEPERKADSASGWKLLDGRAWRVSLATPSIAALLLAVFVCVFCFANFETTLSLLMKGYEGTKSQFQFSDRDLLWTFAYIGFVLAIVQGGIVRRMAGRVSETVLSVTGAVTEIVGFGLVLQAIRTVSAPLLFVALAVVVSGFAFLSPSLNALISRRSDPERQGSILGLGQSVNAMARILGSGLGIPMLKYHTWMPFVAAAVLMLGGLLLILWAAGRGSDHPGQASHVAGASSRSRRKSGSA